MIERRARVVRVEAAQVWVAAASETACGGCAEQAGCGAGALNRWLAGRQRLLRLDRPAAAGTGEVRVGDMVTVGIREAALVQSAVALYLVPIVAMLVSALVARALAAPGWVDPAAGAAALAGLLGGLAFNRSRLAGRWIRGWQPVLLNQDPSRPAASDRIPASLLP